MEIVIWGVVKESRGNYAVITDGKQEYFVKTEQLDCGECVEVVGELKVEGNFTIFPKKIKKKECKDIVEKFDVELKEIELPEELKNIKRVVESIAKSIKISNLVGREVVVHFHNDADGISAALILKGLLKAKYLQHNSAVYSISDAVKDIGYLSQRPMPLVVMLDFGGGEESKKGIEMLKASNIEVWCIDHHPINEETKALFDKFLNGWLVCERGSDYPTGYLCGKISECLGESREELVKSAVAGDKSTVVKIEEEDRERALVLDFLSTYSKNGSGLVVFENALRNKNLFQSILFEAKEKTEKVKEEIKKGLKKEEGKVNIYFLELEKIAKNSEFPSRAKIMGFAFDSISDKGFIVIGKGKKSILLRSDDSGMEKGADIRKIIEKLKKESELIESGGGHSKAGAIRIKEGFENIIVEEIKRILNS